MAASKNDFSIKKKIMKKKLKDLHSFEPGQYLLRQTKALDLGRSTQQPLCIKLVCVIKWSRVKLRLGKL